MIYAMLLIQIDAEPDDINIDEIEAQANAGLPENVTVIGSTIREAMTGAAV